MPNKAQRRALSRQRKLARTTAALQTYVRGGLPQGVKITDMAGVIMAMRALGSLGLSSAKRVKLRARIAESLAKVMKDMLIKPKDFGVPNLDTLAELFIRMLERTHYHQYGITELRRKKAGLKGLFAGELFELMVLNMTGIQRELRELADGQLDGLNAAMRSNKARLIDANGAPMTATGTWTGVQRVTDILVYRGNQKLKFTDFAYVGYLRPKGGGPTMVSFLVETEIKLPRAAAGFAEQMGVKQARFAGADRVEFMIPGRADPVSFDPRDIVFDRGNINRVALTTTSQSTQTWRYRSTKQGGYDETYWRIGLVVRVDELRSLVNVLFQ